jgi:GTP-binding protein
MKIHKAEYVTSVADKFSIPKAPVPVVVFAGRSNVGKSSLINALVNRRDFARVSRTPGKTRFINYFNINDNLYFADLPGYGFARVSHTTQENWKQLIESFLEQNSFIRLVIVILDIRRGVTHSDKQLLDWLDAHQRQSLIVLTKCDKVSNNETGVIQRKLIGERKLSYEPILFSAVKRTGVLEVWSAIVKKCFGTEKVERYI